MNRRVLSSCFLAASMLATTAFSQSFLSQYKGGPYHDSRYQGGPQKIPGRVLCAYYDLGGEGVAYHDTDPKNHGSGELNPADGTYLNEFRIHEGVDTSYTKFDRKPDSIDDNSYDKIVPPRDLPYVGWTEPGEWFNITVDVAYTGTYAADFLYTSGSDELVEQRSRRDAGTVRGGQIGKRHAFTDGGSRELKIPENTVRSRVTGIRVPPV